MDIKRLQELAGIKSNQTVVDFIEAEMYSRLNVDMDRQTELVLDEVLELAKKMEKQQIIQAHGSGQILENGSDYIGMNEETNAEIYYDKTYGK